MGDMASFNALLETVVLLVPAALLLTLLTLFLRKRKSSHPAGGPVHAVATPLASAAPPPPAAARAAPDVVESVDALKAKIDNAIANGAKTTLSRLYLDLAAAHAREGSRDARMAALRSAAGYGALHGPHAAHAAARLALGEEAHQAGDLTSACEQWQLARTAFLDGGDAEQHARVEKRMRDNGCPTDWVLTDF